MTTSGFGGLLSASMAPRLGELGSGVIEMSACGCFVQFGSSSMLVGLGFVPSAKVLGLVVGSGVIV